MFTLDDKKIYAWHKTRQRTSPQFASYSRFPVTRLQLLFCAFLTRTFNTARALRRKNAAKKKIQIRNMESWEVAKCGDVLYQLYKNSLVYCKKNRLFCIVNWAKVAFSLILRKIFHDAWVSVANICIFIESGENLHVKGVNKQGGPKEKCGTQNI